MNLRSVPGDSPLEEVLSAWPSYVGYVVSFLTIRAAWISHSAMTEELDRVDPVYLRLNLLLLLVVVFLPFPTTLITEAFDDREAERVAATVFGLTLLAIRLLGMALDGYARRERLYADFAADEELPARGARMLRAWCSTHCHRRGAGPSRRCRRGLLRHCPRLGHPLP
jgi:uncharacterized membrane protein